VHAGAGAEDTGAGGGVVDAGADGTIDIDEQSAEASGIGTVSVAPASVIRVVVHPQAGIGPPE
jgi:hypothetical protein